MSASRSKNSTVEHILGTAMNTPKGHPHWGLQGLWMDLQRWGIWPWPFLWLHGLNYRSPIACKKGESSGTGSILQDLKFDRNHCSFYEQGNKSNRTLLPFISHFCPGGNEFPGTCIQTCWGLRKIALRVKRLGAICISATLSLGPMVSPSAALSAFLQEHAQQES